MCKLHSVVGLPPNLDLIMRIFSHAALILGAADNWHTFHGEYLALISTSQASGL